MQLFTQPCCPQRAIFRSWPCWCDAGPCYATPTWSCWWTWRCVTWASPSSATRSPWRPVSPAGGSSETPFARCTPSAATPYLWWSFFSHRTKLFGSPAGCFFLTPCCWLSLQTSANTLVVVSIFRFVAVCKPEISESEFYDFLHCVPSDGHQAANIPLHGTVFCTLMGVQAKMWINNNKSVEL